MFGFSKDVDKEIKQVIEDERKDQKENQLKWHNYLLSAIFVIAGLILIVYVQIDIPFICKFLSIVFAVVGLILIISYCIRDVAEGYYRLELVYGITAGFAALLFYTKQDTIGAYFPIIAGFILFANGVVKLQHSIDMKRIDRKMKKVTEMWLVVMIFAIMCIAAGIVTAYIKTAESRTMFLVIGISFIVAGLSDVFVHIVFNRKVKMFRSGYVPGEEPKTYGYLQPEMLKEQENSSASEPAPKEEETTENDIKAEEATEETEPVTDTHEETTEDAPEENKTEIAGGIEFPSWKSGMFGD